MIADALERNQNPIHVPTKRTLMVTTRPCAPAVKGANSPARMTSKGLVAPGVHQVNPINTSNQGVSSSAWCASWTTMRYVKQFLRLFAGQDKDFESSFDSSILSRRSTNSELYRFGRYWG